MVGVRWIPWQRLPTMPLRTGFTTGQAGTGKTRLFKDKIEADPSFGILTATTGTAAVNLGATTINSWLGYQDTDDLRKEIANHQISRRVWSMKEKGDLWEGATIVIDEVSMMEDAQLDLIYQAFLSIEKYVPDVGLELVGDFCQLPPVNGRYAFLAASWSAFAANITKLTKQWRQHDPIFLEGLNAVRRGDGAAAVELLGQAGVTYGSFSDPSFGGVTVLGTNKDVDKINDSSYRSLVGSERIYKTKSTGFLKSEWKPPRFPTHLALKVGARVMVTANETKNWSYVNGDIGTVVEMGETYVQVLLDRSPTPVDVMWTTLEHIDPTFRGPRWMAKRDNRIVGKVEFLPIRLAYALTIHKCQGLTLDKVQFDVSNQFIGNPAMVYVALSRARTPEGLRVIGNKNILQKRIKISEEVRPWL